MAGEFHAHHIVRLALVPIGGAPHAGDGGDFAVLLGDGGFQPQVLLMRNAAQFVHHREARILAVMIECGNIDQIIEETQEKNPRFASILRALSRMTGTPTMINGGIKSNSVPESIRMTCDVRTLPHQDDSYVREQLGSILEGIPGVDIEIDYMAVPNSSPFDTDFARRIQAVTSMALDRNDIQWVPAISSGFTDSRFTRPLGIITYGFSGAHPDDDPMLNKNHGTDESVGIKSLISGTKIMLALACDLLAAG